MPSTTTQQRRRASAARSCSGKPVERGRDRAGLDLRARASARRRSSRSSGGPAATARCAPTTTTLPRTSLRLELAALDVDEAERAGSCRAARRSRSRRCCRAAASSSCAERRARAAAIGKRLEASAARTACWRMRPSASFDVVASSPGSPRLYAQPPSPPPKMLRLARPRSTSVVASTTLRRGAHRLDQRVVVLVVVARLGELDVVGDHLRAGLRQLADHLRVAAAR